MRMKFSVARIIASNVVVISVTFALPVIGFGLVFDLIDDFLDVAHNGGLLAGRSEGGDLYQWRLTTASGCCDRDPTEDFNTLESARNTWSRGIWSDGTTVWVADDGDDKLYAYDMISTAREPAKDFDTLDAARNLSPGGIWSDGNTMWVADDWDHKLYAYDMISTAREPAKDFNTLMAAGNNDPAGIWSDGTTMWVSDELDDKLYAYNLKTTARDPRKDFNTLQAAGNSNPVGIWSDGTTMWVADDRDDKLYAYDMPAHGPVTEGVADFDDDGKVDFSDFLTFAAGFGAHRGDAGYDARFDLNGDGAIGFADFLIFTQSFGTVISSPDGRGPDLVVAAPEVSDNALTSGRKFTLIATARNRGSGRADSTVLRFYRSWDATISRSDRDVGSHGVRGLAALSAVEASIRLSAPSAGEYFYGACIEPVAGEADTENNCSNSVSLTVAPRASPAGATKLYWTDRRTDRIQRADLNGSGVEDLVTRGLDKPNGLALDVSGGKLYWADAGTDKIQRPNLDGTDVEDIITSADGLVDPSDVAVRGAATGKGSGPDVVVESVSVDNANPYAGTYIELSARVRNLGNSLSDSPTLIYYRSTDETITTADTRVGTDSVWRVPASASADASIDLIVPSESGTYYYGACVVSLYGETNRSNNCSRAVTLTVTSPPPFNIEIVFLEGYRERFEASQKALFRRAASRWMSIITKDMPDIDFSGNPFEEVYEGFGRIRVNDVIDDLRIFARFREIDGDGGTVGTARPVIVGKSTGLPKIGLIEIDKDDFERGFDTFLLATMIHEIGHILGFGTLWNPMNMVRGVSDRHFTGPLAIQAFDNAGGRAYGGPKVPVEADSGHWRQSVFGFELMTKSSPGGRIMLSAITTQSLADLGYEVDVRRADEYRLPDPAGAKPVAEHHPDWGDCIAEGPVYVVDENGRIVDVVGEQESVE
ncbi:MAG: hypothetical protein OYM47_12725 [Gemmatimonadota bacterium]|nr:hypothetical protein [Gemmatimonadota bacterium]